MVPSIRLFILVLLGAVPVLLAGGDKAALYTSLVYNGVLAVLLAADLVITAGPGVFRVDREYDYKMSLGAENSVTIRIKNMSGHPYRVIVKDEPPVTNFQAGTRESHLRLASGEEKEFVYRVIPGKRGDYSFGAINIRYLSCLGLFYRQSRADVPAGEIKVYPNIQDIRRHALRAQKGYLQEGGIKPATVKGLGTDFEGLRDYVPDDEYRRVNWTASARRGKLVSNEYQDEKSQNILVVLDSGRMMTARVDKLSKFDLAVNAGLLLGYVGITKDDRVGLAVFDDRVGLFMPPKKGRVQLQKIVSFLYNIQPRVVESDYRRASSYLMEYVNKRSLICVFTDLVDSEASKQLINYVSVLAKRHLVVCITLIDTKVVRTSRVIPESSRELYEKAVAEGVLRERERATAILRNLGVVVVNVPPEELSVATINQYLELKARGRI
ncbi:MAG: DUF58 domain-containing protein [Firmicutes bacterium HGW-Firmicutes-14]|nr:MAG: DUF58 domain-containing protein [Firmicutes bacterium HGW-Firmicutes-14]